MYDPVCLNTFLIVLLIVYTTWDKYVIMHCDNHIVTLSPIHRPLHDATLHCVYVCMCRYQVGMYS